jgi:hypothetical protein
MKVNSSFLATIFHYFPALSLAFSLTVGIMSAAIPEKIILFWGSVRGEK